jgi:alpha-N-arabinofuranosidase
MRSFDNPILPGFHPDPSLCRAGSDYYLATSTFEYFPGVPIFHSKDLTHWRLIGHALTQKSQLSLDGAKSSQGIFAPTLRFHAGTFYLVTTNVSSGGSFYVTARDPAGPWSEPVWLKEPVFGMDPSLMFDDDGKVYYTRHGGGERGAAYQAELDLTSGRLLGEPRELWRGTGGIWPEGPHLYKIQGHYYLLMSEGGTSYGHKLTLARSVSPWGPFEPCPRNPIFTHRDRPDESIQATGHGDLVQTPEGHWFMVMLGIRPCGGQFHHLGRETFLVPVDWDDAGWPVVNGGEPLKTRSSAPGLPPPAPWPELPPRDDFDQRVLDLRWSFVRNPNERDWSLSERPGHLRLHGNAVSLDELGSPAFVGRRQQHHRARVSTSLDFVPSESGQHAGLTLRANEANHYEVRVVIDGAGRAVELVTRVDGAATRLALEPLDDGPVILGVDAQPERYDVWYAQGGQRRSLGSALTAPLSSERAGGFTGVYFGLYATSGGARGMPPADFDWFEYVPLDDG